MKKPSVRSRRVARKQFFAKRRPVKSAQDHERLHNWLTIILSACALVATSAGIGVGYLQYQQMQLARADARQAAIDTGKLDKIRTVAEADQAAAQASQALSITSQLEVSRNQAISSDAQARSMQSLALASRNQASSTQALVRSSQDQYDLQNFAYFETRRSKIEIEFVNGDMANGQKVTYDLNLPITLFLSQHNSGFNRAAVFTDIHFELVEGDFNLPTIFCPSLRCGGRTPVEFAGNSTKIYSEWYQFTEKSLYDDGKDWRLVVIAATNYHDLIQNRPDRDKQCVFYSFRTRNWNVCGI